jgi:hypothetical protein
MGIYRGPGGSTDATRDASSEAAITVTAKDTAVAAATTAQSAASVATAQAANAATSATAAAGSLASIGSSLSDAVAAKNAAETAEANAETAETNAETAQAAAATSATNAASSASAASTSASNASTSATAAATSATNASNSASAASTSATNASNSATAAASSATAAAASYDAFDDRYLGSKTTAPSVDNDGNALLVGALYYRTSGTPQLFVWNGTAWDAAAFSSSGAVTSFNGREGAVTLSENDVMTALGNTLSLAASTTTNIPLHIDSGVTPTTLVNGDIWVESTGLFARNATSIHQLDFDTNTAGVLTQPAITITGSGSTISVGSVEAFLFSATGYSGDFKKYVIPAATGLALTDNTTNYLAVSYNSGSPIFITTTAVSDLNGSTIVGAALLYRNGTEVHYQSIDWGLAPAARLNRRIVQTDRFQRGNGLALGESTGRVITLSAGNIWYGVTEYTEALTTSASSNCEFWYHSSGAWTKSTVSTYNNTQYDNGTNLVTLSGAGTQYAVNWVYRYLNGDSLPKLAYVLGSGNFSLAQAQASTTPTPPPILSSMAILVGRIIVAENASTATQIDSAFTSVFAGSAVTDHNNLAGIQGGVATEHYHLSATEHTIATQAATSSVSGYLTSTDWSTFNSKGTGDVTTTGTQTLTNKTIAYGSNTLTDVVGVTATQTLTNKTLTDPAIIGTILEDIFTITDGSAFEIDPGNGSIQLITLGASRTPKATNFVNGESVILMVDDGTARTLTWTDSTFGGSGVVWKTNAGAAPTLNTTGYTVIVLWEVAGQVYGARVGDA